MQDQDSPAFERLGPSVPLSPIILAVPHAGRIYPPELIASAAIPRSRLETLEDRFADALIDHAVDAGATAFVARRARAWLDLNRDEREIDPAMIESAIPAPSLIGSARVRGGLGLIPRRVTGGADIYRRRLKAAEVQARIARDHRPWHHALGDALALALARFGVAVLLDFHSMPPIASAGDRPPPRIVIGDRYGRSAASRLVDCVEDVTNQLGLRHTRNSPYAGGYALDRHGRPSANIHAIQIEIDRSLYLSPDLRWPGEGIARISAYLGSLVATLAQEALPDRSTLAAE